jgi:hypothetical protein
VLAGSRTDVPWLSADDYLQLGVRQSIFPVEERADIHALFGKYRAWMEAGGLYDSSIVAQQYRALAEPRYDWLVVDEVQDLTTAQLALCLSLLKTPGHFLLCGDANQIVHPNFFSWAQLKTLFWNDEERAGRNGIQVLRANYRNAAPVNRLANRLIKLKQRRFGSIDRESNYLVQSQSPRQGGVSFLPQQERLLRELDEKTRQSARFAVVVLREEAKAEARKAFRTPLVFSVREAKGLEYDHIILYNLVSGARQEYAAIADGVVRADLDGDEIVYSRAKDKDDKSLDQYKFYINALYVAATRAVEHLYVIESDTRHPLLSLLELERAAETIDLQSQRSTAEEWQREARRLELQGRREQAEDIRRQVLREQTVPWAVADLARFTTLRAQALDPKNPSGRLRQQAQEYAAFYLEHNLFAQLSGADDDPAMLRRAQRSVMHKHGAAYGKNNFREVLAQTEQYGVNFRNAFNLTPLMMAARTGNVALIEALLARGADPDLTDNYGRNAFQLFLEEFSLRHDGEFTPDTFTALYQRLAPAAVSLRAGGRLYKLDERTIEFVLYNASVALFRMLVLSGNRYRLGITTTWLQDVFASWPTSVLPAWRRERQYLSGVLSRNEVNRDYAYNRRLFRRMRQGYYALNPAMDIRVGEQWINFCELFQLPSLAEGADPVGKWFIERILGQDGAAHESSAEPASSARVSE